MKTSESIKEIAGALSKAQAIMTGAKKASVNPFFKAKYSDLSQVMEAISVPFAENGLSFIQSPSFENELVTVTTRIMHESGEWIEGTVCLPPTKKDAQGYGSAITYGKRYGLQAMAGVPSVDDDGNAAAQNARPAQKQTPKENPLKKRYEAAMLIGLRNMDQKQWDQEIALIKKEESDPKKSIALIETFAGVEK